MNPACMTTRGGVLRILGLSVALTSALFLFGCGGKDAASPMTEPAEVRTRGAASGDSRAKADQPAGVPQAKSGAQRGKLDPCALLTKADAETMIGEPAKEAERPPTPTNHLGIEHCFYGAASDRSFASAQILVVQNGTIDERARKNGVSARQIFEETKALADGPVRPVTGIGDEAFLSGRKLEVLKGDTYLSISMMPRRLADPMTPATEAAMFDAARNAVQRLSS